MGRTRFWLHIILALSLINGYGAYSKEADAALKSFQEIVAFVEACGPSCSLENVLEKLSPKLKKNLRLVFDSESPMGASLASPRVILSDDNAKLVLAFTSSDGMSLGKTLEIIEFNDKLGKPEFRSIEFSGTGRPVIHHAPGSCVTCHSPTRSLENMGYLWDGYPDWPGVYGQHHNGILYGHSGGASSHFTQKYEIDAWMALRQNPPQRLSFLPFFSKERVLQSEEALQELHTLAESNGIFGDHLYARTIQRMIHQIPGTGGKLLIPLLPDFPWHRWGLHDGLDGKSSLAGRNAQYKKIIEMEKRHVRPGEELKRRMARRKWSPVIQQADGFFRRDLKEHGANPNHFGLSQPGTPYSFVYHFSFGPIIQSAIDPIVESFTSEEAAVLFWNDAKDVEKVILALLDGENEFYRYLRWAKNREIRGVKDIIPWIMAHYLSRNPSASSIARIYKAAYKANFAYHPVPEEILTILSDHAKGMKKGIPECLKRYIRYRSK